MTAASLLLDTHILIWSLYEARKLTPAQRKSIERADAIWISAATIWEIEIKKRSGKLPIPGEIWTQATAVGHRFLAIEPAHAMRAGSLPLHHTDPFDRMLIAQAQLEELQILTVDPAFRAYDVALA